MTLITKRDYGRIRYYSIIKQGITRTTGWTENKDLAERFNDDTLDKAKLSFPNYIWEMLSFMEVEK